MNARFVKASGEIPPKGVPELCNLPRATVPRCQAGEARIAVCGVRLRAEPRLKVPRREPGLVGLGFALNRRLRTDVDGPKSGSGLADRKDRCSARKVSARQSGSRRQ